MNNTSTLLKRGDYSAAFTLVELLVVVAIIALLAALLYPAILSSIQRSWTVTDISSLRQIGTAIALYAGDNNGSTPNKSIPIPGTSTGPGQPDRFIFPEAVDRYLPPPPGFWGQSAYNFLMRRAIWFSKYAKPYPGWKSIPPYNPPGPTAFGYNTYADDPNWMGIILRVPKPSAIVLVAELNDAGGVYPYNHAETTATKYCYYRVNRPGNSALYLFCDYHIEQLNGDLSEPALKAANKPNIWRWW